MFFLSWEQTGNLTQQRTCECVVKYVVLILLVVLGSYYVVFMASAKYVVLILLVVLC